MRSPLLALFNRSLRLDARARSTYLVRAGLVAFVLIVLFNTASTLAYVGAPGLSFFYAIVEINLWFITLTGLSYFASAIAEEKEETTLGLLRMTDLNAVSILLGKSTSRLCGALLLLLAQLPFTLLAVTLGGVSLTQIFAAYVALFSYLILLSSVALFASVACPRTSSAAVLTGGLLFVMFVVPYWLMAWIGIWVKLGILIDGNWFVRGVNLVCAGLVNAAPFTRINAILTTGFAGKIVSYQCVADLVLGAAFFVLAWLSFERFAREQKELAPSRAWLATARRSPLRRLGFTAGRARTGLAAVRWKDFHFINGGRAAIVFRLLVFTAFGAWLWHQMAKQYAGRSWVFEFAIPFTIIMSLVLVLEITIDASRIFRLEVRDRTWSSLALLPMSLRTLAYQKILAALLAKIPTLLILSAPATLLLAERLNASWHSSDFWVGFVMVLFYLGCLVIFQVHLTAYLSLRIKRGALPLAGVISYIGNTVLFGLTAVAVRSGQASAILDGSILLGVSGWLHYAIGCRLQRHAANDG